MEELAKVIKEIKDRLMDVEITLSKYVNSVHGASTEGIDESQGAIVDLEIELAQLEERVSALEADKNTEG